MMEFELSRTRLVLKVLTTTSWCQRNAYGKSVWPHLASAMWGQIAVVGRAGFEFLLLVVRKMCIRRS